MTRPCVVCSAPLDSESDRPLCADGAACVARSITRRVVSDAAEIADFLASARGPNRAGYWLVEKAFEARA